MKTPSYKLLNKVDKAIGHMYSEIITFSKIKNILYFLINKPDGPVEDKMINILIDKNYLLLIDRLIDLKVITETEKWNIALSEDYIKYV